MSSRPSWLPGYYDVESSTYDESRGGLERAAAAATAVSRLVPARGRCLDVAGGTGAVAVELAAHGWSVAVIDLSVGMLRLAAQRLPGRVVLGSADRLPIAPASVDLVTVIWMLNLVPVDTADAVLGEAARVLRPGGHLVVTVDKELAHAQVSGTESDADPRVTRVAGGLGLVRTGGDTFVARTKWGSPGQAGTVGRSTFRLAAFRR